MLNATIIHCEKIKMVIANRRKTELEDNRMLIERAAVFADPEPDDDVDNDDDDDDDDDDEVCM